MQKEIYTVWNVAGGQPSGCNRPKEFDNDEQAIKWATDHNEYYHTLEQAHRRIYPHEFIRKLGKWSGGDIEIPFKRKYSVEGFKH